MPSFLRVVNNDKLKKTILLRLFLKMNLEDSDLLFLSQKHVYEINSLTRRKLLLQGFVCKDGACLSGCRVASDCPVDKACYAGRCQDPCGPESPCGTNALCRVSEHRPVCLCPEGYQGEPSRSCEKALCTADKDCEPSQHCGPDGACRNPCLEAGVCGTNAQCKVIGRRPQCSCSPGYQGNPLVECKQGQ